MIWFRRYQRFLTRLLTSTSFTLTFVLLFGFNTYILALETDKSPDVQSVINTDPVELSSSRLIEEAKTWSGRKVIYTGEAIGEPMFRGSRGWVHLNDDVYMWKSIEEGARPSGYNSGLAIWMEAELIKKIAYYGNYLHKGDIIRVTGTFHAVCQEHGGEADIHADSLEVIRTGYPVEHRVNLRRALAGIILFIVAGALFWFRKKAVRLRT